MNDSRSNCDSLFPPAWADTILRILVGPDNAETVSGDLLEEYRDSVCPGRSPLRADLWFVARVAGYAWRTIGIWTVVLAALQLGRDMLDWSLPPLDYTMRSALTTYSVVGVFIALGCWRAYSTRSLRASTLAAFMTGTLAAAIKVAGIVLVIMLWQDVHTERSGGLGEALELPWLIILPGTLVSMIGGLAGKTIARFSRATPAR
jgi:hypothetical protein